MAPFKKSFTKTEERKRIWDANLPNIHALTLNEHKQLGVLLEKTRLYNMMVSCYDPRYSTKEDKRKSREHKICCLIGSLKGLLDDQVYQQFPELLGANEKIYYGTHPEEVS